MLLRVVVVLLLLAVVHVAHVHLLLLAHRLHRGLGHATLVLLLVERRELRL